MSFTRGERVMTPNGPGRVNYVRMAPPDFSKVEAVSVVLDRHLDRPSYAGTIYPAGNVWSIEGEPDA